MRTRIFALHKNLCVLFFCQASTEIKNKRSSEAKGIFFKILLSYLSNELEPDPATVEMCPAILLNVQYISLHYRSVQCNTLSEHLRTLFNTTG